MTTDHHLAKQASRNDETRRPRRSFLWPTIAGGITFVAAAAALAPFPDLLDEALLSAGQLAWYTEVLRGMVPLFAAGTAFVIVQVWCDRVARRAAP